MSRLRPIDRAFLLILLPIWLLEFAHHTIGALQGNIVEPGVYVSAPEHPAGFPVVKSLRIGAPADSSGLEQGDELLRIGNSDLAGIGPIGFFAHAMQAMGPDQSALIVYRRDGETRSLRFPYTPLPLPIRFFLVSLSFAAIGVLLILRAPHNRAASAVFRAMLIAAMGFVRPWGGPVAQTYFWAVAGFCILSFLAPLVIFAVRQFCENSEGGIVASIWPWLFLPVGPTYLCGVLGVPLSDGNSNLADSLAMVMLMALNVAMIAEFTLGFRRATPLGRRKMKWIAYGMYVTLVPILIATAISLSDPELWWLSDASEILLVLIPISFFVAITRYGIYDIDRIISATASYSLLILIGIPTALTVAPALADAASQAVGVGQWPGRFLLSMAVVSLAIPTHRYLSPRLDRWFFPERQAFAEQVLELLEDLSQLESPKALVTRASVRIDELLRPDRCASYLAGAEGYANIFARGPGVPPMFDDRNPAITVLAARGKPVAAERWAKRSETRGMSAFDRAALESLDAAVVIPMSRLKELLGFTCLGPKKSGDIYTATDLTLLGTIGNRLAAELARFDSDELIREGREMQAALRRYVPGAVADELGMANQIKSEKREVSVLFVDLRGYSTFSESRSPEEIFSMINQYTEIVSEVIQRHSGSVVEFNGDGMMAVFGAPHEIAFKERAAVEAGRAIPEALASLGLSDREPGGLGLLVGVGVATGEAFVGNIQAVDRLIWSAVGNTTNRAARLEALTRDLDAAIVIDEATRIGAGTACSGFEKREGVMLRGYSEPNDLYLLPLGTP